MFLEGVEWDGQRNRRIPLEAEGKGKFLRGGGAFSRRALAIRAPSLIVRLFYDKIAGLAQLVEQWNHNPRVIGPSPIPGTRLQKGASLADGAFFSSFAATRHNGPKMLAPDMTARLARLKTYGMHCRKDRKEKSEGELRACADRQASEKPRNRQLQSRVKITGSPQAALPRPHRFLSLSWNSCSSFSRAVEASSHFQVLSSDSWLISASRRLRAAKSVEPSEGGALSCS